jgi:lipopolysaccharide/colanic/teichoic acid biosynthesis glycosyltransferase
MVRGSSEWRRATGRRDDRLGRLDHTSISLVLFGQTRPGLHGNPFTLYKFRAMMGARDAQGNLLPDAERLTRFG